MELVDIYHDGLKWGKKVSPDKAKVLERSGWKIVTPEKVTPEAKSATVTPAPTKTKAKSSANEPTTNGDDSVSSPQEHSEE